MSEVEQQQQPKKCAVCKKDASFVCASCASVWYCSVEHKEKDRKAHAHYCYPFKIKMDEKGQYLVATTDLDLGATLIVEPPLFRIPQRVRLSCLTCGQAMYKDDPRFCSRCTWPICSEQCEKVKAHAEYECGFFRTVGVSFNYNGSEYYNLIVAAMRAYLIKSMDPELFNELVVLGMEEPEDRYQFAPEDLGAICKPLTKMLGYDALEEIIFDGGMLIQLFAKHGFTCIESKIPGYMPPLKKNGREAYLYKTCSNVRHSCIPNCLLQMENFPGRNIRLRTMRPIKRGEMLTCSRFYTWADDTRARREKISEKYGYLCKCERCMDPTELNTFCSAIRCSICRDMDIKNRNNKIKKGTSILKKALAGKSSRGGGCGDDKNSGYLLPADPLKFGKNIMLKCNRCSSVAFFSEIALRIQSLTMTLRENDPQHNPDIDLDIAEQECLDLIEQNSGIFLHKNHYLIQIAVRILVNDIQYPRMFSGMDGSASMEQVDEYIKLCTYLIKIQDQIRPGVSTLKDELTYSVFEAMKRRLYFPMPKTKENALEELELLINIAKSVIKFHKDSPCEPGEKLSLFASYFTSELKDLKLVKRSLTLPAEEIPAPGSSDEMSVD